MIDEKIKNSIVKKFEIAAKEFDFSFVSPYYIDGNNELCFFCYLYKGNIEKGVLIDIISDSQNMDVKKEKYCDINELFYSCLYIEPLLGKYQSSYFREMLEDWRYEF